jgi:hypothetical protein
MLLRHLFCLNQMSLVGAVQRDINKSKIGVTYMVASRVDEEISILRSWRRMPGGYDEIARQVNKSYAETGDIHQTMRETRLPFDVVWEMVGFKDEFDFLEIGED